MILILDQGNDAACRNVAFHFSALSRENMNDAMRQLCRALYDHAVKDCPPQEAINFMKEFADRVIVEIEAMLLAPASAKH